MCLGLNIPFNAHNPLITQVLFCSFTDEETAAYVDWVTCLILYGSQDHGYLTLKPLIISLSNPFSKWDLSAELEVKGLSLVYVLCILIWEKPVKKEAVLGAHITNVRAT